MLRRERHSPAVANIVFDAQRNEFHAARYQIGADDAIIAGPIRIADRHEEQRRREAGEIFIKADIGPWRFVAEPILHSDARVADMSPPRAWTSSPAFNSNRFTCAG